MTIRTQANPRHDVPAPRSDAVAEPASASVGNALQRLIDAHQAHADGHLSTTELRRRTVAILTDL